MYHNDECPCIDCVHYVFGKQHPNPNAWDEHYCNKNRRAIYQHSGNSAHYLGQWIIPCAGHSYYSKDAYEEDAKNIIGYDKKVGILLR